MVSRVVLLALIANGGCGGDDGSTSFPSEMAVGGGTPIVFESSYIRSDAESRSWWVEGRTPATGTPTERIYTVMLLSSAYNGIETTCLRHALTVTVETGGVTYTADMMTGTCGLRPIDVMRAQIGSEEYFEITAHATAPDGAAVDVVATIYDTEVGD